MGAAIRIDRLGAGLTTIVVMAWFAGTAWARALMLADEGRYVGVAWEMLRSGNWLTPTLNGLPYFHKPPLFYWITAGALELLGHHEFAARVAPILGATLGAMALFLFLRRWASARTARATLAALLVQPLWFLGGQFANLDMLVAGCITATIVLLAHAALSAEQGQPHRGALAAAYAVAAAGVLSKGLIGFVLPAMAIFFWLLLARRWRLLPRLLWWPGFAIFLALVAPWFVAMQQRFPEFLNYFFIVQQFDRFASTGFNNRQPFWFYPAVLAIFFLPWLPWLARSVRLRYLPVDSQPAVRLLMLVWAVAIVVFFSIPRSKLLGYVLPAVPPLAFLVAEGFLRGVAVAHKSRRLWSLSAGLVAALVIAIVAWLAVLQPNSTRSFGAALSAQRAPGEPIYMLDRYYFDLPFYARLVAPVSVVDEWNDPATTRHDGPAKELADAGSFDRALAAAVLVDSAALPKRLCSSPVSWVIGRSSSADKYPFLSSAAIVHTRDDKTLWRVDTQTAGLRSVLDCS
ncbi:MAG: glycosyltransferase family 39 protein [Burkholderiaceae bacterium]|nr:glycosyltransferase family 39 protein [Burkholderiaceae bacterium]